MTLVKQLLEVACCYVTPQALWALSLCLTCVCHSGRICHLPLMSLDNVNSILNSSQQSVNNAVKCPNIMSHPNCLMYNCLIILHVMSVALGSSLGRPRQQLDITWHSFIKRQQSINSIYWSFPQSVTRSLFWSYSLGFAIPITFLALKLLSNDISLLHYN